MRRDIKFLAEFVIWLCGAVRNFIRDVRSFVVPRAQSAHITLAKASISRKPTAFHITRDEVALYHDGNAVHITTSKKSISRLQRSPYHGFVEAKSHITPP